MKETITTTEYAVDLSREEYIRSQEILSKRAGGMTVATRLVSLLMLVVCIVMGVTDWRPSDGVDLSLLSLLVLLIGSEVWMMLTLPAQLRRRSEAAYNATLYRGYIFAGTITVENDAIRKRTPAATTVIPYEQCRMYAETSDMMIFCGMDGRSIVIPARFLTEQAAQATRQAALSAIPATRQLLLEQLVPRAIQNETTDPNQEKSETVLLTVDVEYTDREILSMATETALEQFAESLPNKCMLMTVLASVGYFGLAIKPLPLFLSGVLALFFVSVIRARIRMRRAITQSERGVCRLRIEFSDAYVLLIGKADGMRPMKLPWQHITRAVSCRDTVELYTGKERQLSIPKRCIKDFEELRQIVDSHM